MPWFPDPRSPGRSGIETFSARFRVILRRGDGGPTALEFRALASRFGIVGTR
jgi:hypothetical protein